MPEEEHPHTIIERIVREEWGRVLSILVSKLHDFQLAEDALQDALIHALKRWRPDADGIPNHPSAWLLKVAQRRMIDQLRRRENLRSKEAQIIANLESDADSNASSAMNERDDTFPDERLRLIFTCCHPALAEEARVALTLQTLGGLRTPEVARAFLVPEPTMAQRLVRAKRKIKSARIPYEIPKPDQLGDRFASVLAVIYFIFNEGYSASSGEESVRRDLCNEAIRLGRLLVQLAPEHAEAKGLLALMLLHHARTAARVDSEGSLVTLEHQDRARWDRDLIGQGLVILEDALTHQSPGPFQIQAAISAIHAEAPNHEATDWRQIYMLYQKLYEWQPTPVVQINAIVALSFAGGPEAALDALEEIRHHPQLRDYLPLHATEADLCRRLGDFDRASTAYELSLKLAGNEKERRFFRTRLDEISQTR